MEYHNQNYEISIRRMLYYVLYQWKKILAVALAAALVLGGLKGFSAWKKIHDPKTLEKYEKEFSEEFDNYQTEYKTLQHTIDKLQEDMEQQQDYLDKSVLMQMESHNVCMAEAHFYLDTGYQIIPSVSYQNPDLTGIVLASYRQALENNAFLENIGAAMGLETKYVKELIDISGEMNHILTIEVRHTEETMARAILDTLVSELTQIQSTVSATIGQHTIAPLSSTVSIYVDSNLAGRQEKERDRMESYQEKLKTAQEELEELEEPVQKQISSREAVAAFIKWAVVGGVLGVILSGGVFLFRFIVSDRIYSGDELRARYGMNILGSVWGRKKNARGLNRWLRRAEGRIYDAAGTNPDLLAANVAGYAGAAARILVTGSGDPEQAEKLAGTLQKLLPEKKLVAAGSLLNQAQAMEQLAACDGVVLVESCRTAFYKNVSRELQRISDAGKPLVGCVVVEK